MKLFYSLAFACLMSWPLFSQTIKVPVKKKVVNQVNTRANNDVDKALDKGFDKIEKGIGGLFKKKKHKKHKGNTQQQPATAATQNQPRENNAQNHSSAEKSQPHPAVVKWAKYDFVPGQTVIFEDGPSKEEENGEFPSRWDLYKGNAEIGELNGEVVIMFLSGTTYIIPYLKNAKEDYLPDIFTVEMDVWFSKGSSSSNRLWIYLGDKKNQRYDAINTDLTVMPHSLEFGNSEKDYPGTESIGWTHELTGSWRHIAIAYTKGKFKAYMNDTRLINVPHLEVNPTGITVASGNDNIFIKNIRIAKGGVKYYSRVLSDGKIVENGIRFDVNKATLKPESMGPINKIYKLMIKYPNLKFSVEGHTDSDGDEAHNLELSKRRAKTVMDKFIAMGISPGRLKYTGYGESKPIDNNATPEGKANNRRVEFVKF